MKDSTATPRRALHLVLDGFPAERLADLATEVHTEVFPLTEATAPQALEKIFAADTIAVWTKLDPPSGDDKLARSSQQPN